MGFFSDWDFLGFFGIFWVFLISKLGLGFFGIGIFWDFLGFLNFQIGTGFFWDWDFLGFFGFFKFPNWDWFFLGFWGLEFFWGFLGFSLYFLVGCFVF